MMDLFSPGICGTVLDVPDPCVAALAVLENATSCPKH